MAGDAAQWPSHPNGVVINHRICEGCGDCGDVSNCLSVQPAATPLGRKTQIDQASCNVDLSCLHGDCPAFMTVDVDEDANPQRAVSLPSLDSISVGPPLTTDRLATTIRLSGIGGTGVVTAAQMLGTAALLDGLEVDGVDQTGLSQKAGPVISDLVISRSGSQRRSNLIGRQQADVLVAFDELVAASDGAIGVGLAGHTKVFASTAVTPTGRQITDPALASPTSGEFGQRFDARADGSDVQQLQALHLATALTGTASTANTLLLGVAFQSGEIPVSIEAFEQAIELNGVAIEANLAAFGWGRRWFADPSKVKSLATGSGQVELEVTVEPLPSAAAARVDQLGLGSDLLDLVTMLASDLVAYQDEAYADRFLASVQRAVGTGNMALVETVARNGHKLMAYKDEYEVARLMLADDGLTSVAGVPGAGEDPKFNWELHPPMLRALGIDRKLSFGSRSKPLFKALAKGKKLRGTSKDPFGRAELRKIERTMVGEYESAIGEVCAVLQAGSIDPASAIEIAGLPDKVRGYEDLKLQRATAYRAELAAKLEQLPPH